MRYRSSPPKSAESFRIEKVRSGELKISLFSTGDVNVYLLTERGHRILWEESKVALAETLLRRKGVQSMEQTLHVEAGRYFLVVHNDSDADIHFNYDVQENYDFSPALVGLTGTVAPFR